MQVAPHVLAIIDKRNRGEELTFEEQRILVRERERAVEMGRRAGVPWAVVALTVVLVLLAVLAAYSGWGA